MATAEVLEDSFLSQVERVRVELREKVARAHQVLRERETALLSELQQIETSYRGGEVNRQVDQLLITKGEADPTITDKKNSCKTNGDTHQLDASIVETRERMRRVELVWNEKLEDVLEAVGSIFVRGEPEYKKKGNALIVAGKHSKKISSTPGEFYFPHSIAIDSETNNIYICDGKNDRIQVFTESLEFLFTFRDKKGTPVGICINLNKVFVTYSQVHCLTVYSTEGRCRHSVGRYGKRELEFIWPMGVDVSTEKSIIYICDWGNDRVQCLNLNLTFNSFISDIQRPRDIKQILQDIIILREGSPCILFYNSTHQLTRGIITQGDGMQVFDSWHFSIDVLSNIFVSDSLANCVHIFSNTGELLHTFGKRGERRGEFIYPSGIAIDSKDRIIVASRNPKHCIQMF